VGYTIFSEIWMTAIILAAAGSLSIAPLVCGREIVGEGMMYGSALSN